MIKAMGEAGVKDRMISQATGRSSAVVYRIKKARSLAEYQLHNYERYTKKKNANREAEKAAVEQPQLAEGDVQKLILNRLDTLIKIVSGNPAIAKEV